MMPDNGQASSAEIMMLTNEMATRIAPCRSPIPAPAASSNKARIQMVMPSIKTFYRKKHDKK
jgi:hypothetical protein